MTYASAYLKDEIIRILSFVRTTDGLRIAEGPIFFLEWNDPTEAIGSKILEAISNFRTNFPHPKDQEEWRIQEREWCKEMKIKSWRTFAKGAKLVGIVLQNSKITITPKINLMPKGGFEELKEKARTCSTDPEEIGRNILEAFNDCE